MLAKGTFEVKMQLPPADAKPDPIGRMSLDKTFSGDLKGTSRVEMLTAMTAVKGSAAYVAVEHVTGSLGEHSGTFFLYHTGLMQSGQQTLSIKVVPDSGTEGLVGLEGTFHIRIEETKHFYEFDYKINAK